LFPLLIDFTLSRFHRRLSCASLCFSCHFLFDLSGHLGGLVLHIFSFLLLGYFWLFIDSFPELVKSASLFALCFCFIGSLF